MHFRDGRKEIAVTRRREGNARTAHGGAVQGHEHRQRHAGRHYACAHGTQNQSYCVGRRAGRARYRRRRQHILHACIHEHVQRAHDGHPGDQRDGNIPLGLADLARHHVEIVPAIVGPESRDQRRHEARDAALGARERAREIAPAAAAVAEADHHDADDDADFQEREDQLKLPRLLHPDVVQKSDRGDGSNRNEMTFRDRDRRGDERLR